MCRGYEHVEDLEVSASEEGKEPEEIPEDAPEIRLGEVPEEEPEREEAEIKVES